MVRKSFIERRSDIRKQVKDYKAKGIKPKPFLLYLLKNNLRAAIHYASAEEELNLVNVYYYIKNTMPDNCYGSSLQVDAWIQMKGGL